MMVEILNSMLFGASGAAAAKDRDTRPAELAPPFGGLQSAWFDYMIDTAQHAYINYPKLISMPLSYQIAN